MKHLGDIRGLSGGEIEPVDVITFGSPCQDLSVAGKRAGLAGARSGLFAEAARVIKEMRCSTNGEYPAFAVWENVPGAFSSNKGEDFRAVLETLARLCDDTVFIPRPPKRWLTAGTIMGDGYSIAWRVMDAQYWGVPQRRRRIALVVDFRGQRAAEILFNPKSVRGSPTSCAKKKEATTADVGRGVDQAIAKDVAGFSAGQGAKAGGIGYAKEVAPSLKAADSGTNRVPCAIYDMRGNGSGDLAPTITGDHNNRVTDYTAVCIQGSVVDREGYQNGSGIKAGVSYTLNSTDRHVICMGTSQENAAILEDQAATITCGNDRPICVDCFHGQELEISNTITAHASGGISLNAINPVKQRYIVRRLTPLECERLQGFPDGWTDIQGATDTARYRALGNSIALPQWEYVLQNISEYLKAHATLGSLFDGIGGFPLVWERVQGEGTARWASEIEKFCIKVTKYHFPKAEGDTT